MGEDEAIREFLGDRPGSDELREWRETLQSRLRSLEQERDREQEREQRLEIQPASSVIPALEQKITQLKRQVAALGEEEAITGFVEDSVRATLAMGTVSGMLEELED